MISRKDNDHSTAIQKTGKGRGSADLRTRHVLTQNQHGSHVEVVERSVHCELCEHVKNEQKSVDNSDTVLGHTGIHKLHRYV